MTDFIIIQDYHCGALTVLRQIHQYNVKVRWNGKVLGWRRKESHQTRGRDLERALGYPKIVAVGTGGAGGPRVSSELQDLTTEN